MFGRKSNASKLIALLLVCSLVLTIVPEKLGNVQAETTETAISYGIFVNGTEITSTNVTNVLEDENATVRYDAENKILTLNGAAIGAQDTASEEQKDTNGVYISETAGLDTITVNVIADSTISGETGISFTDGTLKWAGTASLSITATTCAINATVEVENDEAKGLAYEVKGGTSVADAVTLAGLSANELSNYKYLFIAPHEHEERYDFETDGNWTESCTNENCNYKKTDRIVVSYYGAAEEGITYDGEAHDVVVGVSGCPTGAAVQFSTDGIVYEDKTPTAIGVEEATRTEVFVQVEINGDKWNNAGDGADHHAKIKAKKLALIIEDITINNGQDIPELKASVSDKNGFVGSDTLETLEPLGFQLPTYVLAEEFDTTPIFLGNEQNTTQTASIKYDDLNPGNPTSNYVFDYGSVSEVNVIINRISVDDGDYMVYGDDSSKVIDLDEWHKTINIKPDGTNYTMISTDGENWTDTISISDAGDEKELSFYLMNDVSAASNYKTITDAKKITYRLDVSAPKATITVTKGKPDGKDLISTRFLESLSWNYFYNSPKEVTIQAEDDLSGVQSVKYCMKEVELSREQVTNLNEADWNDYNGEFELFLNRKNIIYVKVTDRAGNVDYFSSDGLIEDENEPEITAKAEVETWTAGKVLVTGEIKDDLAGIERVYYKQAKMDKEVDVTDFVLSSDSLSGNYSFTLEEQGYEGDYIVYCKDKAGNIADTTVSVKMDNVVPKVTIGAEPKDWTREKVTISGTVSDTLSGIKRVFYKKGAESEEIEITGDAIELVSDKSQGTYFIEVDEQSYEGNYTVYCEDAVGNVSGETIDVKMDNVKPEILSAETSVSSLTSENVTVSVKVSDNLSGVKAVKYYRADRPDKIKTIDFSGDNCEFTIDAQVYEGDYMVYCVDNAENESDLVKVYVQMDNANPKIEKPEVTPKEWTSEAVIVSGKASDEGSGVKEVRYYRADKPTEIGTATLTGDSYEFIIGAQAYAGDYIVYCVDNAENESDSVKVYVQMDNLEPKIEKPEVTPKEWTSGAVIVRGTVNDELSGVKEVKYYPADRPDEIRTVTVSNNSYEFTIEAQPYAGDYIVYCIDNAGNESEQKKIFVQMDNIVPEVKTAETVPSAWTSGAVIVRGTVSDDLSGVKEVKYYRQDRPTEIGIATLNADNYEFIIPAQLYSKDYIVYCVDNAGNESLKKSVSVQMDNESPVVHIIFPNPETDSGKYYKNNVAVTLAVKETNFKEEGVEIKVNGVTYNGTLNWVNGENNEYKATLNLTQSGKNYIYFKYTDVAGNTHEMTSEEIIIDKKAPDISITYENKDVKNTISGRKYFDKSQTAVITITEENFSPANVQVMVKAKNAVDENVFAVDSNDYVIKYTNQAKDSKQWQHNGNKHTLKLEYDTDANYTFDIAYTDLANHAAADYKADLFTVDKTPTNNLTIDYSTNVFENVLEFVTFGYYNAQMTVTISAEDETSGVNHFLYSYANSEGVSEINAELINAAIENAEISYNGKTATASFNIPKNVLNNTEQFNGTVAFTAFDRAENSTEKKESTRIVVDNISPVATITYNEPVQEANNIAYYAGDIEATIHINEANFYAEDVQVVVTRDGANYPVSVNWVNNSVDEHIGTFILTDEGDYWVTLNYTDRSTNKMDEYASNQLTLDRQPPTVTVTNIKNNSANQDEEYGFTITATDINMDASSFKPVLTAVVMDENGAFSTKTISLGNMQTITEGETYSYTVNNLEADAIYTLSCNVKDMADNAYSQVYLDEDNQLYESVQFSINRDGSTYSLDEKTMNLVRQYYVQKVTDDVVVVEVNADALLSYVLTLNGKELIKEQDYQVLTEGGNGSWMKYTYIINKALFEAEGEYQIVISSRDKAENDAFSDVKNTKINFVVDRTKPVVTVVGLEKDARYQTDKQEVTLIPVDNGGALQSLIVRTVDENGKELKELINLEGEQFVTALEEGEGEIKFELDQGLYQNVQIICSDSATNEEGETNVYDEIIKNISVSASGFMLYWADKTLRYGTIGGVILVAAGILILIVFKRKKGKIKENGSSI